MPRSPPSMGTPVVPGPKDCTTRTGPQPAATSIVGSRSRPCSRSMPRHTSADTGLHVARADRRGGARGPGGRPRGAIRSRQPEALGLRRALRTVDDAVIVGSGPNGLAAAIELARAGASVRVLEARDQIGGGIRTAELTLPGFAHDVCSGCHPMAVLSPWFRSLPLAEHGLRWIHPPVSVAHPLDDEPAAPALTARDGERAGG